jgi:hypothetical protein
VIAAYGIVIGSVGAYLLHLIRERRRLLAALDASPPERRRTWTRGDGVETPS